MTTTTASAWRSVPLLEDPDAAERAQFVGAERADARAGRLRHARALPQPHDGLFDYPKYGCPFQRGARFFQLYNSGLQAQFVLQVMDAYDGAPDVLLDPNALSEDGTVALGAYALSEDGAYLAYGLSKGGSDWQVRPGCLPGAWLQPPLMTAPPPAAMQTVHVMAVADRTVLADTLEWVKFSSLAWTHDQKGFFYSRYQQPTAAANGDAGTETESNLFHKLYYHRLGTPQADDALCFHAPDHARWMCGAEVTDDGRYLLLSITEGCDPVNRLYYCDLSALGDEGPKGLLPLSSWWTTSTRSIPDVANDGPCSRSRPTRTRRATSWSASTWPAAAATATASSNGAI